MTAIANAVIEKVFEGPSGVSKVGPWQIYNFKVEGRDEKFTYFGGEGKAIPRVGMVLEVLQYTTAQKEGNDGKIYDNHTVKKLQTGVSATPPTKAPQTASQTPKTAFVARRDTKSTIIGMYACVKAAGSLEHKNVDELISDATYIFRSVALFAETYRPDLDKIENKMVANEVPADFWDWLIKANKVATKMDLTAEATAYTLANFSTVVKRYVDSLTPQQDEDVIREQTFAEAPILGPDKTRFPGNVTPEYPADEQCPEPVQEECPW